jgi:hypothetical protein
MFLGTNAVYILPEMIIQCLKTPVFRTGQNIQRGRKSNIQLDSISYYIYIYTIEKNTYILKISIFAF